jgi:hypothetical protein
MILAGLGGCCVGLPVQRERGSNPNSPLLGFLLKRRWTVTLNDAISSARSFARPAPTPRW